MRRTCIARHLRPNLYNSTGTHTIVYCLRHIRLNCSGYLSANNSMPPAIMRQPNHGIHICRRLSSRCSLQLSAGSVVLTLKRNYFRSKSVPRHGTVQPALKRAIDSILIHKGGCLSPCRYPLLIVSCQLARRTPSGTPTPPPPSTMTPLKMNIRSSTRRSPATIRVCARLGLGERSKAPARVHLNKNMHESCNIGNTLITCIGCL